MFIKKLACAAVALTALATSTQAQNVVANFSFPWVGTLPPSVNDFNSLGVINANGGGSIRCTARGQVGSPTRARARVVGSLNFGSALSLTQTASAVGTQNMSNLMGTGSANVSGTISNSGLISSNTGGGISGEATSSVIFRSSITPAQSAGASALAVLPPIAPFIISMTAFVNGNAPSVASFFWGAESSATATGGLTNPGSSISLRAITTASITINLN